MNPGRNYLTKSLPSRSVTLPCRSGNRAVGALLAAPSPGILAKIPCGVPTITRTRGVLVAGTAAPPTRHPPAAPNSLIGAVTY
jgi:hypothetical protein